MVANSDTDGVFDREFFRGEPDPLSTPRHVLYWNEEFRSTLWGHMTLLNLKQLVEPIFTGFQDTTNPWDVPTNADIADRTPPAGRTRQLHASGAERRAIRSQQPTRRKALPVDVALGKIDTLDINGSYAGTVPLWYRLLNCGFRFPASAGTDVFLNRAARSASGRRSRLRSARWRVLLRRLDRGLKAGKSFVTNGPMLELTANGKFLGETIILSAPGAVRVQASAEAATLLSKIEVVHNGAVVAARELESSARSAALDQTVQIQRSGWLGARVYGAGGSQAHTSPIYVDVSGQPASSRADAAYFLEWIDRLEERFASGDRVPSPQMRAHVKGQLDAARAVYRKGG